MCNCQHCRGTINIQQTKLSLTKTKLKTKQKRAKKKRKNIIEANVKQFNLKKKVNIFAIHFR